MVHELIGIEDNRVDLRNIGKISKDQQVSYYFIILFPYLLFYFFVVLFTSIAISSLFYNSLFCCSCLCCFLLQEVVLSSEQDAFFKANMYENFGDLGMNIKRMVDEFQHIAKSNQNIQTIGNIG